MQNLKPYGLSPKRWKTQKQPSRVFLRKGFLKICSKFTGEHPCRSAILLKLTSSFIEIGLRHGVSPVNLLHIFRITSPKNTSGRLPLKADNFEVFIKTFEAYVKDSQNQSIQDIFQLTLAVTKRKQNQVTLIKSVSLENVAFLYPLKMSKMYDDVFWWYIKGI